MKEEIRLLQEANYEIKSLRERNKLLSARLDMFDKMMIVLHTEPARESKGGMSPDLVAEIDKFIETNR